MRLPVVRKTLHILVFSILLSGCAGSKGALSQLGMGLDQALPGWHLSTLTQLGGDLAETYREVTPEEEYYLGRAVAARIAHRFPPYYKRPLDEYVSRVGLVLARSSERPETYAGYKFMVLESDEPNSYAAPGGFIFVTTALLKLLQNEDELAAVLAHEVAHVTLRHGLGSVRQAKAFGGVFNAGRELCVSECGAVTSQLTSAFGSTVEDAMSTIVERGYGRGQESDADEQAVHILKRAGYSPLALSAVLTRLAERSEAAGTGILSTHPGMERRAKAAQEMVEGEDSFVPEAVRTKRFLAARKSAGTKG